ncbi:efflux RND transporter periplasmic adaptor subunit [Pedobacter duraquae]|uniref:HlyD family secretion protein n=1 Tax=Pedobacter duraquae TaxID=425511 RepID=A0A4R6IF77_9SPHI|nr:HlyD family efflux transporter periplasmic adaptor subunit [Pedobacter duraquae]TDO20654.1 HlyD family secretion protein [Pedobacter duraquae]
MDRTIVEEVSARRKRKYSVVITLLIAGLILGILIFRYYLTPSINKSAYTTATAEIGEISNTINATGEVLPEFEEVLSSPISGAITTVLLNAGTKIKPGQSILTLDKSAAETDHHKLVYQIESKENEIRKLKLDLQKSFYDINSSNSIKQLRISSLVDAVSNAKRLFKAGGGTREGIEQAELNLKVAELEKKQLENEIKSKQQTMLIEIREAEIALAIQRNDEAAAKRKLNLANIIATHDGVITWVNKNIGASVHEGEVLARIADLSGFKVAGSITDNMQDQVHQNMPVLIRFNEVLLKGHIVNISPAISNSIVSFDIRLDESNAQLRPNQKVDVFLITATRTKVVRVANGSAFKGATSDQIFVIEGNKAVRRTVKTGMRNFDYVEILSGIKSGDKVITSDMSAYSNATTIDLTN